MNEPSATHTETTPIPRDFPPVVYVPCAETTAEVADARPVMQRTKDGRLALLVYSAMDRLYECCGRNQPWFVLPTEALDELQRSQGFQLIVLDVRVPEEHRQQGASA